MAKRATPSRALRALEWVLVAILGALLGSAVAVLTGRLLGDGPLLGAITRTWTWGWSEPATLDLRILSVSFGATLEVGALTLVGLVLALWARARRR